MEEAEGVLLRERPGLLAGALLSPLAQEDRVGIKSSASRMGMKRLRIVGCPVPFCAAADKMTVISVTKLAAVS